MLDSSSTQSTSPATQPASSEGPYAAAYLHVGDRRVECIAFTRDDSQLTTTTKDANM